MIYREEVDLSVAIPENAPRRVPLHGATGFQFLEVPTGAFYRIGDGGVRIPVSLAQEVQLCAYKGDQLLIDNGGLAGDGTLVILAYTQGESMSPKAAASEPAAPELVNRWQGPTSGYVGGSLGALRTTPDVDMVFTGVNVTGDTVFLQTAGTFLGRMVAAAAAGAWSRVYPIRYQIDGILSGLHPTNIIPAAMRTVRPELYRLDIPVHLAALANTGAIGSENECRVHAGWGTSWTYGGLGCQWPGPGVFFVTKADTQTWKAVIAAANRNAPGVFRQEYVSWDTGISYLTPHILTVQIGFQSTGVILVQWAIDGVIVAERGTRLAALLNVADWTPWPGNQGICPGLSVDSELAADTLEVHYAYGTGISVFREQRFATAGAL